MTYARASDTRQGAARPSWLFFATLCVIVAVGVSARFEDMRVRDEKTREVDTLLSSAVRARGRRIEQRLEAYAGAVRFLASVPPVQGIVRAESRQGYDAQEATSEARWKVRLQQIFVAYMKANPEVRLARLIGAADQGREIVRVENDGVPTVVAEAQLQQRGGREFVAETLKIPRDQVYVSSFSLHHERGQLQVPLLRNIHMAMPVYSEAGAVFGVVTLNIDADAILTASLQDLPGGFVAYVLNESGDYLVSPDPRQTYGFDLGQRHRWADDFKPVGAANSFAVQRWARSAASHIRTGAHVIEMGDAPPRHRVTLLLVADEAKIDAVVVAARWNFLLGMLAVVGLFALYSYVFSQNAKRRQQLTVERSRLAAIVESSDDGIVSKTLDGMITSWNRGAEKLFGYAADEVVGHPITLLIPPDRLDEEQRILAALAQGEAVPHFDTVRLRKNGQPVDVSVSVSPIRDADGQVVGASKVVRDITQQKMIEAQQTALNLDLEAQVESRTRELNRANMLLGNVFKAASEMSIIATDMNGLITLFNSGAERMLGYTAEEVVGIMTPESFHVEQEMQLRGQALSAEYAMPVKGFRILVHVPEIWGAETREWTYVCKGGAHLWVSETVTPMRDGTGALVGYLSIAVDVTIQSVQQNQLRAARDELALAAEVAELGVWSWLLESNTLEWNDQTFRMYAQPKSLRGNGLAYAHWRSRVHPDDVDRVEKSLLAAVEGHGPYNTEFRICLPDGRVRLIKAAAQVERDGEGRPIRVTGIYLDITDQRALEDTLRDAKSRADAASAAKSSFLANMSHEIRTPMNAVLGLLQLLQQTPLEPRQRDYLTKTQVAAKSLLGLLNDILDFSKIDAGKFTLDPQPFELEQLMRDLSVVLSGNVGDKCVEAVYEIDPALPASITCDRLRLQQVLINLAGNALKFTQAGQVIVSLTQLARTDTQTTIRFAVTDTGIGISAEQIERIFDGFTQAEASTTRRYGGTGLGLTISKRLVELMGGALGIESELGKGSRFWFDLVLPVPSGAQAIANGSGFAHRPRVLVVDDNDVVRTLLAQTLDGLGWTVDTAGSGPAAIGKVAQAREAGVGFDVVLMDWRMPEVDGLSTARHIQESTEPVPVVVMVTAHGREMLSALGPQDSLPFCDFLTKPVTPQQLVDVVRRAMAGPESKPETGAPVRQRRLAGMRLLVVEDNALNRQVAQELLANEGAEVQLASGGIEGVALATAPGADFDVVIMDVQMPDVDGLEATRRIRRHPPTQRLPILAMTANASSADREACFVAGMNAHVSKPVDIEAVVAALLTLVGRPQQAAGPLPAADRAAVQAATQEVEPFALLMQRFGGNLDIYRVALNDLRPECTRLLKQVAAQAAAGQAREAAGVLHALKGVAVSLGAAAVAAEASRLEKLVLPATPRELAQLLSASVLRDLQRHVDRSAKLLFAALPAEPAPAVARPPMSVDERAALLIELRDLLASGNMRAIELASHLLTHTPERERPRVAALVERVKQLQFEAAAEAIDELMALE